MQSCQSSCTQFVIASQSLVMLCIVPWLIVAMEMRARRQFMREQGQSSMDEPAFLTAWLRHSWLLVLGAWGVFV